MSKILIQHILKYILKLIVVNMNLKFFHLTNIIKFFQTKANTFYRCRKFTKIPVHFPITIFMLKLILILIGTSILKEASSMEVAQLISV